MQASRLSWTSGVASAACERRPHAYAPRRSRLCVAEAGSNGHLANGASTSSSSNGAASAAAAAAAAFGGGGSSVLASAEVVSGSGSLDGDQPWSAASCSSTAPGERRSVNGWPQKSELYLLRSDGVSCTRETVQRE